jgi:HD-like signal output (HDOD) protein/CheY-like chemotaxis protein
MKEDKDLITPDFSGQSISKEKNFSEYSILFVDDEEAILSSLNSLLRKEKFTKYFYSSPKEALRFLQTSKVDLIVSDMKMPEVSGKDFLILASDVSPESIKIVLSGYEEKPAVLDMLANGIAHYYFMKPWDDNELISVLNKFCDINIKLEQSKIKKFLKSFSRLPAPKTINSRLNYVLNSPDVNINLVVNELEYHPFLIAKILQIANSVSYGVRKEIFSLREAIILIGLEQLKTLLVSFELLKRFFDSLDSRYQSTINDFWNLSLKKAKIAKRVAENWTERVDKDLAFLSALLSDIGMIAWLYTEADTFNTFSQLYRSKRITVHEAEKNLFIFEHNKLGSILLQLWSFPQKITYLVENHNSTKADDPYIQIIQIAEQLVAAEPDAPHNPAIDPLVDQFAEKLKIQRNFNSN